MKIFIVTIHSRKRVIEVAMGFVEKFHYLEPAFVYVEVNVPFFEIGSDQTPDFCSRV